MSSSSTKSSQSSSSSNAFTTISVTSARRRLADGLLCEEMAVDPTLCVSTPTTFRQFLSAMVDFGSYTHEKGSNVENQNNASPTTTTSALPASSSPSASSSSTSNAKIISSLQTTTNPEFRGALTDDTSNFSNKCDEAKTRSTARARQIIDEALRRRQERQEKFQNDHEMREQFKNLSKLNPGNDFFNENNNNNNANVLELAIEIFHSGALSTSSVEHQREHDFLVTSSLAVLTLREWREIVRAHPALLQRSLDRSMMRSETAATAMISDMPVTILPARQQEEHSNSNNRNNNNNNNQNSDEEKSIKRRRSKEKKNKNLSSSLSSEDEEEELDERILAQKQQQEGNSARNQSSSSSSDGNDNINNNNSKRSISSITQSGWSYATDYWQKGYQWLERFISGGIAGGVAKSVIAPGDRVKIIFQVNAELAFSLLAAFNIAKQIVDRNGPLGLWAGHGATLLRVVPYASISFATFEFYHVTFRSIILNSDELAIEVRNSGGGMSKSEEKKLSDASEKKSNEGGHGHGHGGAAGGSSSRQIILRFVCGALAGATATTATYPLDLLRARYAAHSLHSTGRPYPSYFMGLKTIYKTEGARSLYSGLGPTLLGIVPYAGASFTVFETLKSFVLAKNAKSQQQNSSSNNSSSPSSSSKPKNELATWQRLSAGALSGLIAQSLTYPLDIVRRRMQVNPDRSTSMTSTLKTVYKESGIRGLYKGLTMNWIKGPIAVAVSFTINDWMKARAQRYHAAVALEGDEEGKSTTKKKGDFGNNNNNNNHNHAAAAGHGKSKSDSSVVAVVAPIHLTPFEEKYKEHTKQLEKYTSLSERLMIGACAGATAKIWTIPFDRLKLMMALGRVTNDGVSPGHQFKTVLDLVLQTRNPFQGAAGQLLRVMPFAAVSYTMFDLCQPLARRVVLTTEASFASDMIAGAMAAAAATVVAHPLDIIRSQFALAEKGGAPLPFSSYAEGLKMLLQESKAGGSFGLFSPKILFHGLQPALMGVCPLAAFSFSIYHGGKRRGWVDDDDNSFTSRMMLGAAAGVVGQVASYPLNLVRRRAIAQAEEEITESIANRVRAGLRGDSYSTFSSMYRRMPLGWTLGTMTLALSFAANDWMRDKLVDVRRNQARELLLGDPTM